MCLSSLSIPVRRTGWGRHIATNSGKWNNEPFSQTLFSVTLFYILFNVSFSRTSWKLFLYEKSLPSPPPLLVTKSTRNTNDTCWVMWETFLSPLFAVQRYTLLFKLKINTMVIIHYTPMQNTALDVDTVQSITRTGRRTYMKCIKWKHDRESCLFACFTFKHT
jgi:hypothetical protein